MKKFLVSALSLFSFVSYAQIPTLPDLNNWEELSEREKAEAGAFFLFYDLAKSKMIGPGSGVCLNYEAGDPGAGSADKISISLDSSQFELAQANGMALGENANKVKAILGKIKKYLDSGCRDQDCKSNRKVTVAGYADATRNRLPVDHQVEAIPPGTPVAYSKVKSRQSVAISKNPSNPSVEESIKANINLATRRATLYAELAKDFANEVYVTAHASPIGEYLREGKNAPAELNAPSLKPGDLKIDCQSRRKAVIEVEFNPHQIAVHNKPDTMGLNLNAGSRDFLFLSTIDATLQILEQSLKQRTRDEDAIIDAVLAAQGINDPEISKGCKNEATRSFVKESLKRTNDSTLKDAIMRGSDNSALLANFKDNLTSRRPATGANLILKTMYQDLRNEGITAFVKGNKLINANAFSSSIIDCFSAKSALKAEMQKNTSLRSQICKSPKDFTRNNKLKLTYDPTEVHQHGSGVHHVGCTGCGTGYNIAKNQATGKYEGYILDRFYGNTFKDKNHSPVMKDHRPISREEILQFDKDRKELFAEIKAIHDDLVAKRISGQERVEFRQMFVSLDSFETSTLARKNPEKLARHIDRFQDKAKVERVMAFLDRAYNKTLSRDMAYIKSVLGSTKNPQMERYYEDVLYPSITAQKKLSGWGKETIEDPSSRMSFGGLKNPAYYVVPNCRCDDQDASVVDKAAGLKPMLLTEFPYNKEVPISDPDNTCIFVPPVPASCSYAPAEKGLTTNDKDGGPEKIRWINSDGMAMEKTAAELAQYLGQENQKFGQVGECNSTDPFEQAQELLAQSSCSGDMALPTNEINDCSAGASRQ